MLIRHIFQLFPLLWSTVHTVIAHMSVEPADHGQGLSHRGSEEFSGSWVNGCAVLRNESHILLLLSGEVQCGPLCLWMTEDAWCAPYMARNPSPVQSGGSLKPHWGPLFTGGSWEGLPSGSMQLTLLSTGCTSNHRSKIFGKKNPEGFIKRNLNLPHSSNYSILLTLYL